MGQSQGVVADKKAAESGFGRGQLEVLGVSPKGVVSGERDEMGVEVELAEKDLEEVDAGSAGGVELDLLEIFERVLCKKKDRLDRSSGGDAGSWKEAGGGLEKMVKNGDEGSMEVTLSSLFPKDRGNGFLDLHSEGIGFTPRPGPGKCFP